MTNQLQSECTAFVCEGQGTYRTNRLVTEEEIYSFAKAMIAQRFFRTTVFNSTQLARDYFILQLAQKGQEIFCVAFLDNQYRVIDCKEMFYGTINQTSVHPREVVKLALHYNAAAVIFAHNHPSGCADPSNTDIAITNRLVNALDLIDVRVLDHLVVGGSEASSFRELGLL